MAETPRNNPTETTPPADAATIDHNIRVVHLTTGEHVICNFGQVQELVVVNLQLIQWHVFLKQ